MTDHPALLRLRDLVDALPETEERLSHGQPCFLVAGVPFAQLRDDGAHRLIRVRTSAPDDGASLADAENWVGIDVTGDPDWQLVEDRVAHSWELAAPDRLLEAGGR